ncbi:unnamed protein product [Meganyctiphanes norvegica]|uniref:Uncharacterized protein n=1 Tax=Meganyctiphanes norvegica TaxID=48144 RepID=A0AAV2QQF6_MEGNR
MKSFVTISAIVLSIAALGWSQIITPYECHCGVFISIPTGEIELFHMKSAHVDGCGTEASVAACIENCKSEWTGMYKSGDLLAELPSGYTLGQEMCIGAVELFHPFIHNADGQVFARNCEGDWEDIDMGTKQPLCCNAGHWHEC